MGERTGKRARLFLWTVALVCATGWRAAAEDRVIARAAEAASPNTSKTVLARAESESTPGPAKQPVPELSSSAPSTKPPVKKLATTAPAKKSAKPARVPTYGNPAAGDDPSRDDPLVRGAAVEALGNLMGSIVAVDPTNGRILTVVNQELAFSGGYQPCSSFKPAVALAALGEGIIQTDSNRLKLGSRWYLTLQRALEISNNLYFETLGRKLGIEKLQEYARNFGFGEPAGWNLEPEPPGKFPDTPPSARAGGVGKVASFGQGISMTLFQLASFTSALANGGTLYYLQYPEREKPFEPKIKRELAFGPSLEVVREGMEQAVLTGTARRAKQPDVHLYGKTGTCSQNGARLGWFTGYISEPGGIAVAVLLRTGQNLGGGPRASEVAGKLFRKLGDQNFYEARSIRKPLASTVPASIQMPEFPGLP